MQLRKFNVKQKFAIVIVVLVIVFSVTFFFGCYIVYDQLMKSLIINQYQSIKTVNQEISQYFKEIKDKLNEFCRYDDCTQISLWKRAASKPGRILDAF